MSNRNSLSIHLADTRNVSRVKGIQFGVLSPEEIIGASVCELKFADTYDGLEPKHHGLFDPRMGVVDLNRVCLTDHHDRQICPGHFGHIKMAIPVFWIQYFDIVMKILRCICVRCGDLLIDLTDPVILMEIKKRSGMSRFNYIYQMIASTKPRVVRCSFHGGCNMIQPVAINKIFMDKNDKSGNATTPLLIEARYDDGMFPNQDVETRWNLRPDYIYLLFRKITDENVEYMGFSPKFSRPEWFICTVLPVCPPAVRPSVRQDNNQRSEDDLTCKLSDIINSNNQLAKIIERKVDTIRIAEQYGLLQYNVATYVNNEMKKILVATQRSGRPLKTLRQRISSKDGRIRGNIMGKRVNYSARTVITPDANIEIDQWGVPERIARNLTIPEIVSEYNHKELIELVLRGPMVHPGAKSVTKMNYDAFGVPHPQEWSLRAGDRSRIVLDYGDIVMRHVRDGDICLFNRQPSLHRNSMMGHRLKIMQGSTFRLNASVCSPYNADFDGDEMNMHVPQSLQTRYELESLVLVPTQIFSSRGADSLIKSVYDAMTGMYMFTKHGNPITQNQLMNYMMIHHNYKMSPLPPDRGDNWSPHTAYSMFLPEITYKSKNMSYADNESSENEIIINKGIVKQGVFDKKILGGGQGGLQKSLAFAYNNWAAKNLVDYTQQFMNLWLSEYGLSVGTGDVFSTLELLDKTNKIVEECHKESALILAETHAGIFEPHLSKKFFLRSLESALLGVTQKGTQNIQNAIRDHIAKDNRFMDMINSGAKGSKLNSQQTLGFVGTTSIMGERVPFNFTHRTLPHFTKDDYGLESRGFIQHSFSRGMSPHELFFHLIGTRVGTIDTAIKSVTGDTAIIIIENNKPRCVNIGTWIDLLMEKNQINIEHLVEKEQELLNISSVFIPTTNNVGCVSWGEITSVTRHNPGNEIYEIKTSGGRCVKVVESKSLIVWNDNTRTFDEIATPNVKIGDKLPVTAYLPDPPVSSFNHTNGTFTSEETVELLAAPKETIRKFIIDGTGGCSNDIMNMLRARCDYYNSNEVININNNLDLDGKVNKVNDVMLDSIVEINRLNVVDYPKVYDITVPSTLNFGLANGLHVRDTADSGYLQRRLIKAMEDISVQYDQTVRTAVKTIVEFRYGDDGFESTKLQSQPLEIFMKSNTEMSQDFDMNEMEWKMLEKQLTGNMKKSWANVKTAEKQIVTAEFEQFVKSRDILRDEDFKYSTSDIEYFCPISFPKLLQKLRDDFENGGMYGPPQFLPSEVLARKEKMVKEFYTHLPDYSARLLEIQFRSALSIKRIIFKERWNKLCFDTVEARIRNYFYKGLCCPGEMVGVLTGQMIGEPATQMSCIANTKVIVQQPDGTIKNTTISEFIDPIIEDSGNVAIITGECSLMMNLRPGFKILSVSGTENTRWRTISQISRHPASGNLIRIKTKSGRGTTATLSHSFLRRTSFGITPVLGCELIIGDHVPSASFIPTVENPLCQITIDETILKLDAKLGLFIGAYLAAGTYSANNTLLMPYQTTINEYIKCGPCVDHNGNFEYDNNPILIKLLRRECDREHSTGNGNKRVPSLIYGSNNEIISGVIDGFFNNNGAINANEDLIDDILILLSFMGIFGCKTALDKTSLIKNNINYDIAWDEIVEINILQDPKEYVYDFTVPGTETFMVDNGIFVHNTLNSVEYNTPVWLRINNSHVRVRAGEWIDRFMSEIPDCLKEDHGNNTLLGWTPNDVLIQILSVDDIGRTSWKKVEAITVHPPVNEDGTNTILKITTRSGRSVSATNAKSFLIFDPSQEKQIVPVRGDELKIGMMVPIAYRDCAKELEGGILGYQEGYIYGCSLRDGEIGHTCNTEEWNSAFMNHPEWCNGILQGLMHVDIQKQAWSTQEISEERAEWVSWIAGRIGQTTRWEIKQNGNYIVRSDFETCRSHTCDIWGDAIVTIENVQSVHPRVYDFTVEDTRNFVIANGMGMRDTFHLAGVGEKSVITTTGVPRMREIINLGKDIKTPSMRVFLKEPYRSDVQKAKELKSKFEFTQLGSLLKRSHILFDAHSAAEGRLHRKEFEEDDEFIRLYSQFANTMGFPTSDVENTNQWVIRLELDRTQMMNHNLRMTDIRRVIENDSELTDQMQITFSDDNAGELIMRMRIKGAWDEEDPVAFLQDLVHKQISKIIIQGIQGIQRVSLVQHNITEINTDGKQIFKKEWIIETDGINMYDVLMFDFVNAERMVINDFHKIKDVFGIEAARALLLHEFRELLNKADLKELNYRHLSLVIDVMTYRGILMPIDRHGMKRSPDISPFAKASNEESMEIMVNASIFADIDRVTGVSSNILFGQQYVGGTNAFEILLDEEKMMKEMPVNDANNRNKTQTKYDDDNHRIIQQSAQSLFEEVARQTLWTKEDSHDIIEETVEASHPGHAGFLSNDPFTTNFNSDRRHGLLYQSQYTTIPRPPLFRSQKQWITKK